jgi:hypothetical protein
VRVLVTGSRTWKNGLLVREKLGMCLDTAHQSGDSLTVVHGACKSGADSYADAWARWHQRNTTHTVVRVEPHPANWEGPCIDECQPHHRRVDPRGWDVCPAAGFYRNEAMVRLGADLVLAFIADESKGATHCARFAETCGLQTLYFRVGTGSQVLF